MTKKPADIHPLDLGLMFYFDPNLTPIHIQKGGTFKTELLKYKGKLYRQTVEEPKWKSEARVDMLKNYLALAEDQLKAQV